MTSSPTSTRHWARKQVAPFRPEWSTVRFRQSLAVALVAGLAAAGCSSGSDEPQARPGVSQQRAEAGALDLDVTAAEVVSPHQAKGPLDGPTREAVLATLQKTFDATVVGPLRDGDAGSLRSLFTDDAAERATGPDRAAVFDDIAGPVDELVVDKANVRLTGLHGDKAEAALVVAKIDWDVRSADGSVRVRRIGELSLIPVFGTWLVGAYSVITSRTADGDTTTTTAATP